MEVEPFHRKTVQGVLIAIAVAILWWGWGWLTGGGLVHALGGVTTAELEVISKRISSAMVLPPGAVVAFDRPEGCPEGWELEDDAVGSVIVGVGATVAQCYG